jgi:hypothetical protein
MNVSLRAAGWLRREETHQKSHLWLVWIAQTNFAALLPLKKKKPRSTLASTEILPRDGNVKRAMGSSRKLQKIY